MDAGERLEAWRGRRVTVVGLARSGFAACRLLTGAGALVWASDIRAADEIGADLDELRRLGVRLEVGGHTEETFLGSDLIVLSPGVDARMPLLGKARARGVPIISEIELAYRASGARFIGITGTKGKGTTATLLGRILEEAGMPAVVAGNIGQPLSAVVADLPPGSLVVAEISSFQLETIERFRAEVAVLLNLAPDHLDRYATVEEYYGAKARLLATQGPEDVAVLNADDPLVLRLAEGARARRVLFSRTRPVAEGAGVRAGVLVLSRGGADRPILAAAGLPPGPGIVEDAVAACAAAAQFGATPEAMAAALARFRGREHCLEFVAEVDGVRYVNDSKATNVFAVARALEAFPGGVILLLGGRDKREDFRPLRPLIGGRVKALVLLGEARPKLREHLAGAVGMEEARDLEEAVARAAAVATPGDVVLFSPGCTSFDMFRNAEERGTIFKVLVQGRKAHVGSR